MSDPAAINWAFAIGHWLAQDPEALPDLDPLEGQLAAADPDVVRGWYAQNADAILACTYAGAGP